MLFVVCDGKPVPGACLKRPLPAFFSDRILMRYRPAACAKKFPENSTANFPEFHKIVKIAVSRPGWPFFFVIVLYLKPGATSGVIIVITPE